MTGLMFPKEPKKPKEKSYSSFRKKKDRKQVETNTGLMFPKQPTRKERKQHPPSMLQNEDDNRCFLCMMLDGNLRSYTHLEEHHMLKGKNRSLSEKYGLKVKLCYNHHRDSSEGAHFDPEINAKLENLAQRCFVKKYGYERFMEEFKHDYIAANSAIHGNISQ